jgi:PAS domain S-box-containing protein
MLWEDALASLSKGETDLCDMFASKERGKHYLFSKPIYNLRAVLAVRNDLTDVEKLQDLNGKVMAMQKGDFASEYLEIYYPGIKQYYVADIEEALMLLAQGKVAATLGDEPVVFYQLEKNGLTEQVRVIEKPIYENQVVFAVPNTKPELIPILNKGIDSLRKKDVLEKVQQKWFGISAPIVKTIDPDRIRLYISIAAISVTAIIVLMSLWNYSLKTQIQLRTKELEDSRNDLQIVFDGMTEYMIVLDRENRVMNINTAFLSVIGMEKHQVVGKHYKSSLGAFAAMDLDSIIEKTYRENQHFSEEKLFRNEVYEINTYPLEGSKRDIKNILILINNVTSERISSKKLLQANKMVAIGELAAGIAHEIRNPLAIVRSHSFILRSNNDVNSTIAKSLDYIDSAVERASNIVDNLLNFSRISGEQEEWIGIYEFISNIMSLQSKTMQKKNITYTIECKKDYLVLINQESLKHILMNLVSNAVDSIENKGKIIIKAYPYDKSMVIECIDTGTGIKEEDLERIFNPFYTTKGPDRGTGLGLYIVYNEIKKLKGDISVESKTGIGTKFKLIIPIPEGVTNNEGSD